MVLAALAAHVGSVASRRARDDRGRHRRLAIGAGLALLAILIGMPWPFMPYGRPLLRLP
jgi:hypothetical protein